MYLKICVQKFYFILFFLKLSHFFFFFSLTSVKVDCSGNSFCSKYQEREVIMEEWLVKFQANEGKKKQGGTPHKQLQTWTTPMT